MLGIGQTRRLGGEFLILGCGGEAAMGLGVIDDIGKEFLAERGQRALPELAGGFALFDEYPLLRRDRAGIHPVREVIDGAACDRVTFLDGPFHRGDAAVPRQPRRVLSHTAEF